VKSKAQDDDIQEVKGRKRHITNYTSQTAEKSTKSVSTSAAVKMPPKEMLTRNFFALLRTTDMDKETTKTENTLSEQEASRKPGRPPSIEITSSANFT
jgi:hypothetical protein